MGSAIKKDSVTEQDVFISALENVNALKAFIEGKQRYSTALELITDPNAEYQVQVRKHFYGEPYCIV